MSVFIRVATKKDSQPVSDIYAPVVRDTFISFEAAPPDTEEMAKRINHTLRTHPWLVAEVEGTVVGYAYASPHRSRAAYQWSVDVSAYVAAAERGKGTGRALYTQLFDILRLQGFVMAHAGIALPNSASVAFHEQLGFRPIGTYTDVGFKKGSWRDVGWWKLKLQEPSETPEPPVPFPTVWDRLHS
ncbi:MAG: arsinothricin resistance N-acetyltransferase ArsN1 family B [Pseudomonadota bacterium]